MAPATKRRRHRRRLQAATPLLGTAAASTLFAVALLFSGQNATLTGTLAGQIVMEGFLDIRLRPWLRRLITRLLAIVPAIIVIVLYGERGTGPLIVLSQVVLSLQLPFAIFPLVQFTSDPRFMGPFTNKLWINALAWPVVIVIAGLNVYLLYQTAIAFFRGINMYHRILVAIEHSKADAAILEHIEKLARLTGASLLLVHVADGFAARHFDELNLRESEEMKDDRAYLTERCEDLRRAGLTVDMRAGHGRPGHRTHSDRRGRERRSHRDVDARPSISQRRDSRHHGRQSPVLLRGRFVHQSRWCPVLLTARRLTTTMDYDRHADPRIRAHPHRSGRRHARHLAAVSVPRGRPDAERRDQPARARRDPAAHRRQGPAGVDRYRHVVRSLELAGARATRWVAAARQARPLFSGQESHPADARRIAGRRRHRRLVGAERRRVRRAGTLGGTRYSRRGAADDRA